MYVVAEKMCNDREREKSVQSCTTHAYLNLTLLPFLLRILKLCVRTFCQSSYFVGSFVAAFGAGAIKPAVIVMGADQYNENLPEERLQRDSFCTFSLFLRFYVLFTFSLYGVPSLFSLSLHLSPSLDLSRSLHLSPSLLCPFVTRTDPRNH